MTVPLWVCWSFVGLVGLLGCAAPSGPLGVPFEADAARVFVQRCAACHGGRAEGGVGPPLDSTGHAHHHSDSELVRVITEGVRRPGAATEMPAWGKQLSPREVRLLVEFVKSLWTEEQRRFQGMLTASQ